MARRSLTGLESGIISSKKTTTPKPPMKWVLLRQKRRLRGRASTLSSMLEPVVVKPETLSNQAFATEKGPPQRAYGSIPNTNERSHDRVMVTYPSLRVMAEDLRTNIKGKIPTVKVMVKLIISAAQALSLPFSTDVSTESSINRELTSKASPTLRLIPFQFI